ncbi:hypothetical protein H5410_023266 [Solanum commersonii]|uniref:Uncharacterized protein n=1 Tax=Solanum commersonii TaxID=4109 RepID=A0A9J5ZGC7_SOLCO|nr:hypothetical protein H5410_023266 [Solanum commersonii]
MHAYNRVPSSGQSSPSAPSSPRLRSKPAPRFPATQTLPQHLASQFLSLLLRGQGIFLFAPLIYISAVLFYINTLDFHNLPPPHYAPPGSVYRSPQLYANLRPQMDSIIPMLMRASGWLGGEVSDRSGRSSSMNHQGLGLDMDDDDKLVVVALQLEM